MKLFMLSILLLASFARAETSVFQAPTYQNFVASSFSGLNDTTEDTVLTYSPTSGVMAQEAVLDLTALATTVTCTIRVKRTISGGAALGPCILGFGLTLANALAGTCVWTRATDMAIVRVPMGFVMGSGDSIRVTAQCSLAEGGARAIPYVVSGIK